MSFYQDTSEYVSEFFEQQKEWMRLSKGTRLRAGLREGWEFGKDGNLALGIPLMAFELGHAPRGEFASTAISGTVGLASYPIFTSIIAGGLALVGVPLPVATWTSALFLATSPSQKLGDWTGRGIRRLTSTIRDLRRINFGRNYQDSPGAQLSRLRSLQEMSGALGTSRRLLGSEAAYFHR